MKYVILLLCYCFVASWSFAEQHSPTTLQINGSGIYKVTPDAYQLTFVLEQKGEKVSDLNSRIASDLDSIVAFLTNNGIRAEQIASMALRLNPHFEHTPQGRIQKGFVLRREVNITSTTLENYDAIIDGALSRGVNTVTNFNLISTEQDSAYDKALAVALRNAKVKASIIAKEMDIELGQVVAIFESGGNMPVPVMRAEAFSVASSGSLPGEKDVTAHVSVTYSIQQ